ncbi:unnamed protein product [Acanthoscelides obtectus]|uniref:Mediator of RNA polymerase II transcription subunit 6 n=1 Tax=Acanthoscelides obtectus TaxID=200917 RepID=A0A9P0P3X7_ACAOB|nr:unnamed protein product [Acanthoscelides obtectus]CAK1626797.1 Mediator of RNA polymerase II transcription subunit 6 [Acanthoscelides obtectus]
MMAGRLGITAPGIPDNPLSLSWHDSAWIPILNPSNVLEYFSQGSNPFYDRTCNNEIVKMQRLNPEQLQNMTGLEYLLVHMQEPILYVIRKQHRHSLTQVTPLAEYYIIAGVVYQAPDLASVLNSRLLSCVHHIQGAFEETMSFARYHPSKGYSWDFKSQRANLDKVKKEEKPREEPSSLFQRQRVDMLLGELIKKFPLPTPPQPKVQPVAPVKTETDNSSDTKENRTDIKQEKIKPPPEKKPRMS